MPGNAAERIEIEDQLVSDMVGFAAAPFDWVMYSFPWGEGELADCKGPEPWQEKILLDLQNGLINYTEAIQMARASGHGIGKSTLVAWLILWAMSTKEDTRGVVTANTDTQLRTKTWPELAKWHRLFIAKHWFELTATAIYRKDDTHEKNWRIDLVPWSKTNTEAFAGLHNKGKRILLIFDEASAIDDAIWEVAEGALTDESTEIMWFAFGNPTRNTGRFHACFHRLRHRWNAEQIDSRTVSISDKKQIAKWEQDYGSDSDFFRVRVKGEFPKVGDRQFIGSDLVEQARSRKIKEGEFEYAAKIITLDNAWTGGDEVVIGCRQGLAYKQLMVLSKNDDDIILAGYLAKFEDEEHADAVFIDLGYGTGVFSAGKNMNRRWTLVSFASESSDPGYLNKRAQMWGDMKKWLQEGGVIPDDAMLAEDITGPEYEVKLSGKIVLESKQDMKKRGIRSPNRADALALSFAYPVKRKTPLERAQSQFKGGMEFANSKYDPLAM